MTSQENRKDDIMADPTTGKTTKPRAAKAAPRPRAKAAANGASSPRTAEALRSDPEIIGRLAEGAVFAVVEVA